MTAEIPSAPDGAHRLFGERRPRAEAFVAILADTGVSHGLIGPREVPILWERHVLNCAVVAELLRPGGRLFIREGHPMLWAMGDNPATGQRTLADGEFTGPALEFPYFEMPEPLVFDDGGTYVETEREFNATVTHEWNHGLGEIVTALLDDEATVKTLKRSGGKQWLLPQNPIYDPIDGDHASIMGKVTAVLRSI